LENRRHSYRSSPPSFSLSIRDAISDEAGGMPPLLFRHHRHSRLWGFLYRIPYALGCLVYGNPYKGSSF
jgi:hypothetical protein